MGNISWYGNVTCITSVILPSHTINQKYPIPGLKYFHNWSMTPPITDEVTVGLYRVSQKNVHAKPGHLRTRLFSDSNGISSQKLISLYFIKICRGDQELWAFLCDWVTLSCITSFMEFLYHKTQCSVVNCSPTTILQPKPDHMIM